MSLEALNLGMHQVVRVALPRLRGHAPTTAKAHEGLLLLVSKQNCISPFTVGKSGGIYFLDRVRPKTDHFENYGLALTDEDAPCTPRAQKSALPSGFTG